MSPAARAGRTSSTFTIDPEEALAAEGAFGPVAIVSDEYDDEPDYEIELDMDPDGYWFGASRDWTFAVESLDPSYPPRRILRQMVEQTSVEWAKGETTVSLERHLLQIYQPILTRRDRITATSTDGDRVVVLTKLAMKRTVTRDSEEAAT